MNVMKRISGVVLLILTLLIQPGWCQKNSKKIKKRMWQNSESAFAVTKIPKKWENESAVVIAKSVDYEYMASNTGIFSYVYTHYRIKLLDKKAVKEFSELSFKKSHIKSTLIGIKVIKPNGKVQELDSKKDIIAMKANKDKYYKVAVPNLEVGDILDYYERVFSGIFGSKYEVFGFSFGPTQYVLTSKYPIMHQKLGIYLFQAMSLRLQYLNNAPKLKRIKGKKATYYEVTDKDREAMFPERWAYKNRVLPVIRFETFPRHILSGSAVYDKISSKELYKARKVKPEKPSWFTDFKKWSKKKYRKNLKELSKETLIKAAYSYMRWYYYEMDFLLLPKEKKKKRVWIKRYQRLRRYNPEMAYILDKYNIKYKQFLVLSRKLASIENIGFKGEPALGFEIEGKDYCFTPGMFVWAQYFPYNLQNAKKRLLDKSKEPVYIGNTHQSPAKHNKTETNITVVLNNQDQLSIRRELTLSGASKFSHQAALVTQLDIANSVLIPNDPQIVKGRKNLDKKQLEKDRIEKAKKLVEDEFSKKIEKIDNFELVHPGRTEAHPHLIYKDAFTLDAFVKKVGNNYIFEVGKLIGGQIEIKKEEQERKYDIYMKYARSFEHTINFTIPESYQVQGLDKFNFKVENETGGFTSSATIEGNQVIIKTRKFYNHNFEKVRDWGKMVAFLDAAYQFTQQKLLLKKVSK